MNQDESVALWRQGKDAWNAWAEDMLRQKAELEKSGTWNGYNRPAEWSDETRKWSEAARTDLSGLRFMTLASGGTAEKQAGQEDSSQRPEASIKTVAVGGHKIDFYEFVFPWHANFKGAEFHGEATFRDARFHEARFGGVQFHGEANFEGAQFHGYAGFGDAQFHSEAYFGGAEFRVDADFLGAKFHGKAKFEEVGFKSAVFWDAQFHGMAFFFCAEFWEANFQGVQFHGQAIFSDALFHDEANFTAIKAGGGFDLTDAQFSMLPGFNQADFKQPPDLDNVSFPPRPFWRGGDKRLIAKCSRSADMNVLAVIS